MQQKITLLKEPNLLGRLKGYPFQKEAVEVLKNLEYGAIFHEQGLGKTKIAIDIFLEWLKLKSVDTVIIFAKKNLVHNWKREINKHTEITPLIISQKTSENDFSFNRPSRLIISHYEALQTENERFKLFSKTRNIGVILDESTKIKNPESILTKIFFEFSTYVKKKLILTGLPVANRPFDLWSQIYFLDNGRSLGRNFKLFQSKVDIPKTEDQETLSNYIEFLSKIFPKLKKFSVRETKDSGVITLPNKEIINIECEWETKQKEYYNDIINKIPLSIVKEGIKQNDVSEDILKRLLRLVQAASNPILIDEKYKNTPGKFNTLKDLLDKIVEKNEKAIVWSTFVKSVDWLKNKLNNFNAVKSHGKINIDDRNRAIDNFLDNKNIKVLVATPASSKEGLTLTSANHVIFFDRGFSLDDYYQSQDRIHRISQEKTCYIYNLIMKDSIDLWVNVLLEVKSLSAKLAQGDITKEEFKKKIPFNFTKLLENVLNRKYIE